MVHVRFWVPKKLCRRPGESADIQIVLDLPYQSCSRIGMMSGMGLSPSRKGQGCQNELDIRTPDVPTLRKIVSGLSVLFTDEPWKRQTVSTCLKPTMCG